MAEKGKITIVWWLFSGKKQVFGHEKMASGQPSRKLKWCKTQVLLLKTDKTKGVKSKK